MNKKVTGEFEVNIIPQEDREIPNLARMTIDKQFHGDLEAISRGQMLSAATAVQDSAGYVAIERVEGKLEGLKGSFVLLHVGIMNKGESSLTITVIPDSGTDSLVGLTGVLDIKMVEGKHFYDFSYSLSDTE
ncbi:MAG: DUF3224 domain-containing protein [bacterium]|nr:DUF3224 domain-containing protein [bacterium]